MAAPTEEPGATAASTAGATVDANAGAGAATAPAIDADAVGALLGAALRGPEIDPDAAEQARLAFRAAREGDVHAPAWWRRRARDDWRPRSRRPWPRSLKALIGGLAVTAGLGGVAIAAVSGAVPSPFGGRAEPAPPPTRSASPVPGTPTASSPTASSPAGDGTAAPDEPVRRGQDITPSRRPHVSGGRAEAAHCRTYLADPGKGRGGRNGSTAFERLVTAAGGDGNAVRDYCERLLAAEGSKRGNSGVRRRSDGAPDAKGNVHKEEGGEG
ncbi:hypothetical protein [Streptomyces sannanensis]|uniref:hypothetical protein n=1 Tax=Streptomyces sannanensis TaxID=285536 RepID=UPI0031F009E0